MICSNNLIQQLLHNSKIYIALYLPLKQKISTDYQLNTSDMGSVVDIRCSIDIESYSHNARRYMSNGMIHVQRSFREIVCSLNKF